MSDNYQVIHWRERVIRRLITDICRIVTNLLLKLYITEIREIDIRQSAPGFAHLRLHASFDEIDLANEEEDEA